MYIVVYYEQAGSLIVLFLTQNEIDDFVLTHEKSLHSVKYLSDSSPLGVNIHSFKNWQESSTHSLSLSLASLFLVASKLGFAAEIV